MVKKDDYNIGEFEMGREIEGLDGCVLFKHKGLTGIIRKTDKTIIVPPKYHNIWDFKEGRAKVRLDGKYGYIDCEGNEVIKCKYDTVEDFSEGRAKVTRKKVELKYGCINNEGKVIARCKYDHIYDFKEGIARVKLDGKYGFVNLEGKEIVECVWDYAEDFKDGKALVQSLNGDFYIGRDGHTILNY